MTELIGTALFVLTVLGMVLGILAFPHGPGLRRRKR